MKTALVTSLALICGVAYAQGVANTGDYSAFIAKAKANLTANFKDPTAAQFRNLIVSRDGGMLSLCGEVNGKNSYGAYVGFRKFFATEDPLLQEIAGDVKSTYAYTKMEQSMCGNKVADAT